MISFCKVNIHNAIYLSLDKSYEENYLPFVYLFRVGYTLFEIMVRQSFDILKVIFSLLLAKGKKKFAPVCSLILRFSISCLIYVQV